MHERKNSTEGDTVRQTQIEIRLPLPYPRIFAEVYGRGESVQAVSSLGGPWRRIGIWEMGQPFPTLCYLW